MRNEAEVVALSWIPSEAVRGAMRLPFDTGIAHYDEPPPDEISDLETLRDADRFRFANRVHTWAEFDERGRPVEFGFGERSGGLIGSSVLFKGRRLSHDFAAFAMPDIQYPPEVGDGSVRFVQTAGGRTGVPAPRRVRRAPFVQWRAPLAWSTLALTLHADGRAVVDVRGASRFPRHWIYGADGALTAKTGMTDFKDWYRRAFGKHSPWGDEDSPALITAAETALERQLSSQLIRGDAKPAVRTLKPGATFASEGEAATELYLVLDGVVRAEKAGERLAEYGPGALLGERAGLDGAGRRTATLVAVTACRVAVAAAHDLDPDALAEVSRGHRREEEPPAPRHPRDRALRSRRPRPVRSWLMKKLLLLAILAALAFVAAKKVRTV